MDVCGQINSFLAEHYALAERPALEAQRLLWSKSRPLVGVKILDATPVFRNTMCKYLNLLVAGADLTISTSDKIPFDLAAVAKLKAWNIKFTDEQSAVKQQFDIIMDCAGVHAHVPAKLGYVELTRSGAYYYKDCPKPIYLADSSLIKEIETMLGTGNGFIRGMKKLGFGDWAGKKVVVFGCGKVGRGIAFYLSRAGAHVTAIDQVGTMMPDSVKLVDMLNACAVKDAMLKADLIVSATGIKGALENTGSPSLWKREDLLLANIGIEDEFGDAVPDKSRVINSNRPVNFILEEPTLLRYIDPTMALCNQGALLLVNQKLNKGVNIPTQMEQQPLLDSVIRAGLINEEMREGRLIK